MGGVSTGMATSSLAECIRVAVVTFALAKAESVASTTTATISLAVRTASAVETFAPQRELAASADAKRSAPLYNFRSGSWSLAIFCVTRQQGLLSELFCNAVALQDLCMFSRSCVDRQDGI